MLRLVILWLVLQERNRRCSYLTYTNSSHLMILVTDEWVLIGLFFILRRVLFVWGRIVRRGRE